MMEILVGLIVLGLGAGLTAKIAKDPDWGIGAIFFLLPFERIPTVEIAGFSLKLNHIVGGLAIFFWIIELLKKRSKFVRHPTNQFIWLTVVAFILSFIGAVDPLRSVIFFVQALFVFALYALVVNRLKSVKDVERISQIILFVTWLVVLFALYQFIGDYIHLPTGLDQGYTHKVLGFPRVQAFSKEPLYLANFLFIPLGVMVGYLLQEEKPMPKFSVMLLPLIILVFLLTVSRGAYLGLLTFGLACVFFFGQKLLRSRPFILASLALVVAMFLLIAIIKLLGPQASERFFAQATARDIELSSESIFGRLRAFGQAVDIWRTAPYTGVGLGGFGPSVGEVLSSGGYSIVNNQYLELLAESGFIGLLAFVLILASVFVVFAKVFIYSASFLSAILAGLMSALVGTLVQYNFFSTFAIIHIWVLIGLIVAIEAILLHQKRAITIT